jgi:RNA polymerase sigma-70 factor (ECF subfamily)
VVDRGRHSEEADADPSESSLLAALRQGDDSAFGVLVRTHGGRMLSVAKRFFSNSDEAQDAVQEAFLSAFKALPTFDGRSKLGTWLHRIVVNASLMKLRSQRRHPVQSIEELLPQYLEDGHRKSPSPRWKNVDCELEKAETRQVIRDQIAKLPEAYRTVLLLRDIEGYDTDSVACVKPCVHFSIRCLGRTPDVNLQAGDRSIGRLCGRSTIIVATIRRHGASLLLRPLPSVPPRLSNDDSSQPGIHVTNRGSPARGSSRRFCAGRVKRAQRRVATPVPGFRLSESGRAEPVLLT